MGHLRVSFHIGSPPTDRAPLRTPLGVKIDSCTSLRGAAPQMSRFHPPARRPWDREAPAAPAPSNRKWSQRRSRPSISPRGPSRRPGIARRPSIQDSRKRYSGQERRLCCSRDGNAHPLLPGELTRCCREGPGPCRAFGDTQGVVVEAGRELRHQVASIVRRFQRGERYLLRSYSR